MNQPHYSDNGGGNPRHGSSGNRRNVSHSTGRSNYGGSSYRGNKEKGAIGKWIQNRRQRRRDRRRGPANGAGGRAVGTEANAIQNMANNAKWFKYPAEGFVTPIEHSLLYAMIEFPERYPEAVVKAEIEDEEFEAYLYVNDAKRKGTGDDGGTGGNSDAGEGGEQQEENGDEGGDRHAASSSRPHDDEERVSYAQLSALAALSAEKNPSTATPEQTSARPASSTNNNDNSAGGNSANSDWRGDTGSLPNRNNNSSGGQPVGEPKALSIGQTLVRKLLRTITRYSDARDLDRQHEIREFLSPIERRCQLKNEKAALQQLLPAYAGYTISLVTGNPLPLLIGAAALTQPDPMMEENSNVSGFRAVGGRAGDMETAGLLDECESD